MSREEEAMIRSLVRLDGAAYLRRVLRTRMAAWLTKWRNDEASMKIACFPGDDIGDNIIAHGWYEDLLLKGLFGSLLAEHAERFRSGAAADVGANIGNHSMWFSQRFARVLAFEPNPVCVKLFEANVLMNGIRNVHLFPVGLSDRSAELMFHMNSHGNVGRSGLAMSLQPDADMHFMVRVNPGDAVLTEEALGGLPLRLLKLDIEGHELRAIKGLERTISAHRPIVLFESHTSAGNEGSDAIVEFLSGHGYQHYYVIERVRSPFKSSLLRAAYRLVRGEELRVRKVPRPDDRSYSLVVAATEPLDRPQPAS